MVVVGAACQWLDGLACPKFITVALIFYVAALVIFKKVLPRLYGKEYVGGSLRQRFGGSLVRLKFMLAALIFLRDSSCQVLN